MSKLSQNASKMNMPKGGGMGKGHFKHGGERAKKGTLKRLIKMLYTQNKKLLLTIIGCLLVGGILGSINGIFMRNLYEAIEHSYLIDINEGTKMLTSCLVSMGIAYAFTLLFNFIYTQLGTIMTHKFLFELRAEMFAKMQKLPIRYFDRNNHGDIMSHYTNDADALRQMLSQSLPSIIQSLISITMVSVIMISYSLWLTLVIILGLMIMLQITKRIGGNAGKFFMKQQKSLGEAEGYVEEMMTGQKVVKVFNYELKAKQQFDKLNDKLYNDAKNANTFANILMPILGNVGNMLYVLLAFVGGAIVILSDGAKINIGLENIWMHGSLMGALTIPTIIVFLNMSKQFSNQITQASNQLNAIVMALAGASRIFDLLDQEPEKDEGYVTLVNATKDQNGVITESKTRTNLWAWKHPHGDGTVTFIELKGNIILDDVDFGYLPEKIVLHNVSLYAHEGQKVAFVGSTGAGKTTITNLINAFYDIADGKIRYDGINISKIKKNDLRRSLGIVLQDTNLFTGTVMENIRYGKLDATDEEVMEAGKLANAHDFITRLPNGYNTMLTGDGSNLSQGQRQLLSIARAAVCNAPVMILDEATSSIDTRTELLVQKGTDKLMQNRTVFVIAHRLSTIQNSDVIMVLEQGRIIERGSHDELIEKKGKYYQLYTGAFELE